MLILWLFARDQMNGKEIKTLYSCNKAAMMENMVARVSQNYYISAKSPKVLAPEAFSRSFCIAELKLGGKF